LSIGHRERENITPAHSQITSFSSSVRSFNRLLTHRTLIHMGCWLNCFGNRRQGLRFLHGLLGHKTPLTNDMKLCGSEVNFTSYKWENFPFVASLTVQHDLHKAK
jgi:hypothetical protein